MKSCLVLHKITVLRNHRTPAEQSLSRQECGWDHEDLSHPAHSFSGFDGLVDFVRMFRILFVGGKERYVEHLHQGYFQSSMTIGPGITNLKHWPAREGRENGDTSIPDKAGRVRRDHLFGSKGRPRIRWVRLEASLLRKLYRLNDRRGSGPSVRGSKSLSQVTLHYRWQVIPGLFGVLGEIVSRGMKELILPGLNRSFPELEPVSGPGNKKRRADNYNGTNCFHRNGLSRFRFGGWVSRLFVC
mmetsp:Transcript_50966/g.147083  ORF Transcript_50966/g.147083 Transcript_50966/m.147083 type:complete len:243 (-) Transcript_50966:55-783(-)